MNGTIRVLLVSFDERESSLIENLLKEDMAISTSLLSNIEDDFLKVDHLTNFFKTTVTDVIILCDSFRHFSILELIKIFKQTEILLPVIVISSREETSLAVEVIKAGGENFLVTQHLTAPLLIDSVYSALQTLDENRQLATVRLENLKLLKAVEQSPVSIVITKAETNQIEYANPRFTELTGYSFEEVKGKLPSILKSGQKTDEDYKKLWNTITSGNTWKGQFSNRRKDGSLYYVSAVISPIKVTNNEITHYVGIHEDVTLQKEADEKLRNYATMLEKKSKQLEEAYQDIEEKIQRAKQLHKHFFPINFPKLANIELEAFYEPASNIGSDYYNFVVLNNQLIVYIVDVSGSGIDGAFINIFIRQKINRFFYTENGPKKVSPKELLNFIAKHFIDEGFPEEYFLCIYVAVIDLQSKELTYGNAGIQVPPIFLCDTELISLPLGGLPISSAISLELLEYEEDTVLFGEKSTLVLVTDGIVESVIDGEMYGIERLQKLICNNAYLPAHELKKVINHDIEPLLQKQKSHDDITYVIIQHKTEIVACKKFVISSNCHDVEMIIDEVAKWLELYTCEFNRILVGFNEMVYNAIEHGNKFDSNKKVEIHFQVYYSYLLITVTDEGNGFDWKERMKRQFDIMNFEERGRGIIFTKQSFDYITYNSLGNKVYLYKKMNEKS